MGSGEETVEIRTVEHVRVLAPDDMKPGEGVLFLICSENYADEIRADLERRGVLDTQMAVVDDMDACVRFIIGLG